MKFIIERKYLLKPLQQISSTLSRRPILPILNNLLLQVMKDGLLLISTDLEIEISAWISLNSDHEPGTTTVAARKFFDICRNLSEDAKISVILENNRMLVRSGRSRYLLSTLPASEFPNLSDWESKLEFSLPQAMLKRLIESTQFSMANQDVRYYLNGMLFETEEKELRAVATDGHRLAICSLPIDKTLPSNSIIVPRKGVIGLFRMLDNNENLVKLQIGSNNIRVSIYNYIFTSKLIDGRFPDYRCVLPKNPDKVLEVSCEAFRQAFNRVAILSNEKLRGVRLYLSSNQLKITANNSEQEEAEEILDVFYRGNAIEICFNVTYILDVLNSLKCDVVRFLLNDEISSVQIEGLLNQKTTYIIMPMRL